MKLRSFIWALLCILLAASPAGSGSMTLLGVGKAAAGGGGGFVGPMNITGYTSPYACLSLRACSAAIAAANGNIADIVDTATGTFSCTIKAQSNGDADLTSLLCTGGTLSVTTFCTVTHAAGCSVAKLYDQSGNGRDFVVGVAGGTPVYPQLALTGLTASKAAMFFDATFAGIGSALDSSALPSNTSQPFTFSYMLNPVGVSGGRIFSNGASSFQIAYDSGASALLFAGTVQAFTPITGWQSAQFVLNDPSASTANVSNAGNNPSGTPTTLGGSAGSAGFVNTTHLTIGTRGEPAGDLQYNGYIFELIILTSAASSANQALMVANQRAYGAF